MLDKLFGNMPLDKIVRMLPQETIDGLSDMLMAALDKKLKDAQEGNDGTAGILIVQDKINVVLFNQHLFITRILEQIPVKEFINLFIKNLKDANTQ